MRLCGSACLVVGLFLLGASSGSRAGEGKAEAVKKDLKQLEGNWKMVRMELEGRSDSGKGVQKSGVLFDGTQYSFLRNGLATGATATITIDPTKDPKEINFKITGGTGRGATKLGIYRFTPDGRLEICMNQHRGKNADRRPTRFTTKPSVGSGSVLYVLERDTK